MITSYEEWLERVAASDDIECRKPEFFSAYQEKMELVRQLSVGARIVAEIGVRTGYSAHAFLSAADSPVAYFGYDTFGKYYNWKGGWDNADKILRRDFPETMVCLFQGNTQAMTYLGLKEVSLFHVDGDHTTNGCIHDMNLAWLTIAKGGVMIVDDYDFIKEVRIAVDRFLLDRKGEIKSYSYFRTFRGDMAMVKA